jgi:hypothetical protein
MGRFSVLLDENRSVLRGFARKLARFSRNWRSGQGNVVRFWAENEEGQAKIKEHKLIADGAEYTEGIGVVYVCPRTI